MSLQVFEQNNLSFTFFVEGLTKGFSYMGNAQMLKNKLFGDFQSLAHM